MRLSWLGHCSVKLEIAGQRFYIDPYAGAEENYTPANAILISRWHFDHCSLAKVKRATGEQTSVLGTPEVASNIFPCGVMKPGDSRMFNDVEVVGMRWEGKRVPMRGHSHEPESRLGFTLVGENKRVYYMADSSCYDKLKDMYPDVALVAVGNRAREAAKDMAFLQPKLAVPIGWGSVYGSKDDALLFQELAGVPVKVLKEGEVLEL